MATRKMPETKQEEIIDDCVGCNEKIEGFDRWTCRQGNKIRFAHWDCIKKYNLKWTPYN